MIHGPTEAGNARGAESPFAMLDLDAPSLDELGAAFRATGLIHRLLRIAVEEDTGGRGLDGDRTALALDGGTGRVAGAHIVPRRPGIAAGLAFLDDIIGAFGSSIVARTLCADGQRIQAGAPIATLRGPLAEIVVVERTMLNLLGRLCGIATLTARFIDTMASAAPGSPTRLCDTRKTTPGLRLFEKYAVRCGGGTSHRLGLHDGVMLKDNHIAGVRDDELAAFVRAVSERARAAGPIRFVQVEVDRLEQLDEVLLLDDGVVDLVLLDNMPPTLLEEALRRRNASGRRIGLEASGGVTLDTIGAIARTRIDRVSTGAITHAAAWLDIALDSDAPP